MHLYNKFKPPFEIVSQKFFSKIKYGELSVTFPSGYMQSFAGINSAHKADLTINNYKFISKILKRKSVGFAESYMDGDFSSSNLTNLLLLAFRNENHFLENLKSNIFLVFILNLNIFLMKTQSLKVKKIFSIIMI